MRSKSRFQKAEIRPDPQFNSLLVSKFINKASRRGKKETAARLVYLAFAEIKEKTGSDPLVIFERSIENASPLLEVRSRRIGGATYQVPMEVPADRRVTLAQRWIIAAARAKKGKNFAQRLAEELLETYQGSGEAVRRKEEMHRAAEANRAFAHYARF